jgi:hypothetical protein
VICIILLIKESSLDGGSNRGVSGGIDAAGRG